MELKLKDFLTGKAEYPTLEYGEFRYALAYRCEIETLRDRLSALILLLDTGHSEREFKNLKE